MTSLLSSLAYAGGGVSLLSAGDPSEKKVDTRGWVGLWKDRFEVPKGDVGADRPIVWLKGLPPRAVTAELGYAPLSVAGAKVEGTSFTLEVQRVGETGHRLVLREGAQEQTLFQQREGDLDGWHLSWAGDLDGDGRADFLLSADEHYNVTTLRLFLSSRAKKGALVREVAKLRETGC